MVKRTHVILPLLSFRQVYSMFDWSRSATPLPCHHPRSLSPRRRGADDPVTTDRSIPPVRPMVTGCSAFAEHDKIRNRSFPSQPEYEHHGLVAHLPQFRGQDMPGLRYPAQPRQDVDILLAAGLERHGRRREAGADIDLPELLQGRVVVGGKRSVGEAGEDQAARRGDGAAVVRIDRMGLLFYLSGERIDQDEIGLVALDASKRPAEIVALLDRLLIERDFIARCHRWNVEQLGALAVRRRPE